MAGFCHIPSRVFFFCLTPESGRLHLWEDLSKSVILCWHASIQYSSLVNFNSKFHIFELFKHSRTTANTSLYWSEDWAIKAEVSRCPACWMSLFWWLFLSATFNRERFLKTKSKDNNSLLLQYLFDHWKNNYNSLAFMTEQLQKET